MNKFKLTGFADEIDPSIKIQIETVRGLGISYIELRGVNGKNISQLTEEEAKELKAQLDEEGVGVSAIGSPIGKVDLREGFEEHFQLFKHTARLCKILGTRYMRIFSFFIPENKEPEKYGEEVIRRLSLMRDHAREMDIVLLHENEKDIYGDNAKRCKALMDALYGDNFKAIFDFANFVQVNQDTAEAFGILRPYIHYVHIKDAKGQQVVPPGMGEGKLPQLLKELYSSGYSGFLSLEPHLADFAGFSALEHKDADPTGRFGDGSFAFTVALNSLKAILFDITQEPINTIER